MPKTSLGGRRGRANLSALSFEVNGSISANKGGNVIKEALASGKVSKKMNKEKQIRHIKGNKYCTKGNSYITGTLEDAEKLINKLSGTGSPIIAQNGIWTSKERVSDSNYIGVYVSKSGHEQITKNAIIIYSRTGTHIIPARR